MARCSICYTVIAQDEAATACPDCTQDYHQSCWDEIADAPKGSVGSEPYVREMFAKARRG